MVQHTMLRHSSHIGFLRFTNMSTHPSPTFRLLHDSPAIGSSRKSIYSSSVGHKEGKFTSVEREENISHVHSHRLSSVGFCMFYSVLWFYIYQYLTLSLYNYIIVFMYIDCCSLWRKEIKKYVSEHHKTTACWLWYLTFEVGFGWLVGFLTSSSTTRLYLGQAPRQLTCCHTWDRAGRPWLLSQPVTLYWHRPNQ